MILCKWLWVGFGLLFSAMLAASAQATQTMRIGLAEDPDLLDPTLARTYVGRIVFASLCDKLVDISPELDIVPQLATEWQWTDDNKGLVMKIRPGVKFQDGEPLDAAAVKFSLERHLNLPGSNRKAEISAVTNVDVIDDHTVKLVLSAPFAPLLAQLTDRAGMIVSPKAAQAGGDFSTHPVCAGPYKFTERVAQDRIVLDRFADYWNKDAIHFDRIVFLPIVDSTVRLANLQSGGLDLIERVAATDVDTVKRDGRLKLGEITGLGYIGITTNLNNGPRSVCGPCAEAPASIAENSSANPAHSHYTTSSCPRLLTLVTNSARASIHCRLEKRTGRCRISTLAKIPETLSGANRAKFAAFLSWLRTRMADERGSKRHENGLASRPVILWSFACQTSAAPRRHKSRKASVRRQLWLKSSD